MIWLIYKFTGPLPEYNIFFSGTHLRAVSARGNAIRLDEYTAVTT